MPHIDAPGWRGDAPPPLDLLRWYLESGVDECIGADPVDRYAAAATAMAGTPDRQGNDDATPPPPRRARAAVAAAGSTTGPAALPGTAAHVAAACATLGELHRALDGFDGLPLKQGANTTVFADGADQPRLMVIGEAPGQEEDRRGLPFVGASGQLLDRMLASIGLDRAEVYITNVVPWRPPANRKPTPDEVAVCLPFICRHIELVDPPALLLLGGAAAAALLARAEGINRLRGRWYEFSSPRLPRPVPTLATFHPAYLLRTPEAKREAWRDLLMLSRRL